MLDSLAQDDPGLLDLVVGADSPTPSRRPSLPPVLAVDPAPFTAYKLAPGADA